MIITHKVFYFGGFEGKKNKAKPNNLLKIQGDIFYYKYQVMQTRECRLLFGCGLGLRVLGCTSGPEGAEHLFACQVGALHQQPLAVH